MVYPLLFLGMVSIVIILDRAVVCYRSLRLPGSLLELVETYGFSWEQFDQELHKLPMANGYGRFFSVIERNRSQPPGWVESRAGDEAGAIKKTLGRGM
jgi:biopolymer transport protein ExbB